MPVLLSVQKEKILNADPSRPPRFSVAGRRPVRFNITVSPRLLAEGLRMGRLVLLFSLSALVVCLPGMRAADKDPPEGFEKLFNGKDLSGWKVNEGGKLDRWGAADGILFTKGAGGGWL